MGFNGHQVRENPPTPVATSLCICVCEIFLHLDEELTPSGSETADEGQTGESSGHSFQGGPRPQLEERASQQVHCEHQLPSGKFIPFPFCVRLVKVAPGCDSPPAL